MPTTTPPARSLARSALADRARALLPPPLTAEELRRLWPGLAWVLGLEGAPRPAGVPEVRSTQTQPEDRP